MNRVYLDHALSSLLRPAAFDAMVPFLRDHFADRGRVHSDGRVTRVAIETAREQVAAVMGARPRDRVHERWHRGGQRSRVRRGATHLRGDPHRDHRGEHSSVLDACPASRSRR